mgnify:CR=1 FL=1
MINQRITKLRQLMKERGIDLYIIPTSDFHQSEYVGSYFEARIICLDLAVQLELLS